MSWCILRLFMVFSWDSSIRYFHDSIERVFSYLDREGIFVTRSRGYFHISIEKVFSCIDQAGIFMAWSLLQLQRILQRDPNGTWPLFGQVWRMIETDSIVSILSIWRNRWLRYYNGSKMVLMSISIYMQCDKNHRNPNSKQDGKWRIVN